MSYNQTGVDRIRGGEQSKFDNTIGDLITIRRLCDHATESSLLNNEGSFTLWNRCLNALERELWPYLDEKEKESIQAVKVTSIPVVKGKNNPSGLVRARLDQYHKKLLELRGKKGLGLQASDDPSTAALR